MSPPHHVLPEKPLEWQWALHLCGDSALFWEEQLCRDPFISESLRQKKLNMATITIPEDSPSVC